MLYQLDDLNLSEKAFRLLFCLIRRGYRTKIARGSLDLLQSKTGLSKHKLRRAIAELVDHKLVQMSKTLVGFEFVFMPTIIKIIDLDYRRKGKEPTKQKERVKGKQTSQVKKQVEPKNTHTIESPNLKPSKTEPIKRSRHVTSECFNTKGELYYYFREWLKNQLNLEDKDICALIESESKLTDYWQDFRQYAQEYLTKLQQGWIRQKLLGKIKFYKHVCIS